MLHVSRRGEFRGAMMPGGALVVVRGATVVFCGTIGHVDLVERERATTRECWA